MLRQLTISLQLRILFHLASSLSLLKLIGITSFSLYSIRYCIIYCIIYCIVLLLYYLLYYLLYLSIVLSYLILSYYLFYYLLAFIQLNREIISGCNKIPLDLSILFKNSV